MWINMWRHVTYPHDGGKKNKKKKTAFREKNSMSTFKGGIYSCFNSWLSFAIFKALKSIYIYLYIFFINKRVLEGSKGNLVNIKSSCKVDYHRKHIQNQKKKIALFNTYLPLFFAFYLFPDLSWSALSQISITYSFFWVL